MSRSPSGRRRTQSPRRSLLTRPVWMGLFCIIIIVVGRSIRASQSVERALQDGVRVRTVIDGDTVELSSGQRVRYIGVDTPEIRQKRGGVWLEVNEPFAQEAKQFNIQLVEGKSVRLEYDVERQDKYGRTLAYVFVDEVFVNAALMRAGLATLLTIPPNVRYVELFTTAQREARAQSLGLWGARH